MTFEAATAAPFAEFRTPVKPEWIDDNGHMGIRSYTQVFDEAIGPFYRHIGLTREHLNVRGTTIFALQETAWYRREVMLGDPLLVTAQLIDFDHDKMVTFQRMHQTRDGYVAAMAEIIEIHIDRTTRRPADFAPEIAVRLSEVHAAHRRLGVPAESGRGVGIRRRSG